MIERFVSNRRPRWERLSVLLDRAASMRHSLSVDEMDEMARLYRQATGDLAVARRDFPRDPATAFVNQLVARGHSIIYREPPAPLSRLRRFFTNDLPGEFRAAWPYMLASSLLFLAPLLLVSAAIIASADVAELMLPSGLLEEIKAGRTWFDFEFTKSPYAASFIMTNNVRVALLALAGGMLAGVGTAFVLVNNGIHIGAVAGALIAYGLGDRLVGFVSPHGFLELSVIVIAGACGLMLGRAIVWSDLRPRGRVLVDAGARSVRILTGSQVFLVIAGLIEGFVSPLGFPWPYKLAIGLATAAALYAYLLLAGRSWPGRRLGRVPRPTAAPAASARGTG